MDAEPQLGAAVPVLRVRRRGRLDDGQGSASAIHAGSKPGDARGGREEHRRLDQREARDHDHRIGGATEPGPVLAGRRSTAHSPGVRPCQMSGITRNTAVPGTRTSAKARSAWERMLSETKSCPRVASSSRPNAARRAKPAATISATLQSAARTRRPGLTRRGSAWVRGGAWPGTSRRSGRAERADPRAERVRDQVGGGEEAVRARIEPPVAGELGQLDQERHARRRSRRWRESRAEQVADEHPERDEEEDVQRQVLNVGVAEDGAGGRRSARSSAASLKTWNGSSRGLTPKTSQKSGETGRSGRTTANASPTR